MALRMTMFSMCCIAHIHKCTETYEHVLRDGAEDTVMTLALMWFCEGISCCKTKVFDKQKQNTFSIAQWH